MWAATTTSRSRTERTSAPTKRAISIQDICLKPARPIVTVRCLRAYFAFSR